MDSTEKYNKSLAVFNRFTSRSSQIGTNQFNKFLNVFELLVESSENNDLDAFLKKHNFESKENNELSIINFSTPSKNTSQISEKTLESINSSLLSSASKTSTPFKLIACKNTVGRPKGTLKNTATSFKPPKTKRKAKKTLNNLLITSTQITSTTTTTTTTETITTSNKYGQDDTLEEIVELREDFDV